jgi:hypothetical protein
MLNACHSMRMSTIAPWYSIWQTLHSCHDESNDWTMLRLCHMVTPLYILMLTLTHAALSHLQAQEPQHAQRSTAPDDKNNKVRNRKNRNGSSRARVCVQEHRSTFYVPYWNIPGSRYVVPRLREFHASLDILDTQLDELVRLAVNTKQTDDLEALQARDYSKVRTLYPFQCPILSRLQGPPMTWAVCIVSSPTAPWMRHGNLHIEAHRRGVAHVLCLTRCHSSARISHLAASVRMCIDTSRCACTARCASFVFSME